MLALRHATGLASPLPLKCSRQYQAHTGETRKERIARKLQNASNILIFGVGGGNDSFTALLMKAQLERDYLLKAKSVTVVAMLPDVLAYYGLSPTVHPLVGEITSKTERCLPPELGGKRIRAFPEPVLAEHKDALGVERVLGIRMDKGSEGVYEALDALLSEREYDLVLAVDVGADFIAAPENKNVLSPMMDAYALRALRRLSSEGRLDNLVCAVFGLGSDGESSPEMLHAALDRLGSFETGRFDVDTISSLELFYWTKVHPVRASRTTPNTLRSIRLHEHDPLQIQPWGLGQPFEARFHTKPTKGRSNVYYGPFEHKMDPMHAGRYILFDELHGIQNYFEVPCSNGIDWFLKVNQKVARANHELNGQSYTHMEATLGIPDAGHHSLLFGTPSSKFAGVNRQSILNDIVLSIENCVFDCALMYADDIDKIQLAPRIERVVVSSAVHAIHLRGMEIPLKELRRLAQESTSFSAKL